MRTCIVHVLQILHSTNYCHIHVTITQWASKTWSKICHSTSTGKEQLVSSPLRGGERACRYTLCVHTHFSVLSDLQVQSKKITDFMDNPVLITSASNCDSDDSLNEFSYLQDAEQESGNSLSPSRSSISDESDIEDPFYPEYCSSLPFPKVSTDLYAKQYS